MAEAIKNGHGSSLSNTFNDLIIDGLKLITIGVAAAVAWQIFLDPIFFPIFHDPLNVTAQAWVSFINSTFSFIPDFLGLTGDWGLLQTDVAQNILSPYVTQVTPPDIFSANVTGF